MTENDDPGDKTIENASSDPIETSPNVIIPAVETTDINDNQKTENMDIHAHHLHNVPGKKIWHYFFEFLMLFLAVFCGFMAENWREQLRDHHREKEFILSIVEDLKSDSIQSNKILVELKSKSAGIDSVLLSLLSPDIINNSNNAYRLWSKSLGLEVFVANDRSIEQLKNSGELRLIRNKAVSDRIMNYEQILKKYSVQSNLMYSALTEQTSYEQLFDFISLSKNKDRPVPLTTKGRNLLSEAYGRLQLWNAGLTGLISWLDEVKKEGIQLKLFIQKEYQIE